MKIKQRFVRIRQNIEAPEIIDKREALAKSLDEIGFQNMDFVGKTVGITAGSRGIADIPLILSYLVNMIQKKGGIPIIIPAMGTHGGATAERQLKLLDSLGITEQTVGCPIMSKVETQHIGNTYSGVPVYCNVEALKMDLLVPVNRVKSHTDFTGEIESGICKMLAIGLGAHKGAESTHSFARIYGHERVITEIAQVMCEKLPITFAVGIAENWKSKTARFLSMLPREIIDKEGQLLKWVKKLQIKLPFDKLDVLIVHEMGKNISGTGMDTKVVGRIMVKGQIEPEKPKIGCIVVLNLTPESHGNACGIGLADITTKYVFDQVDYLTTADNAISSMSPEQGRLPCVVPTDYDAIRAAIYTIGPVDPEKVRMVYIKNTLDLETVAVTESLLEEIKGNQFLELSGALEELQFDENKRLLNFWR